MMHEPKIGELWIYKWDRSGSASNETIVVIDYLDEDVIWFSFIEYEEDDDWCAIDYFMSHARRYDGSI